MIKDFENIAVKQSKKGVKLNLTLKRKQKKRLQKSKFFEEQVEALSSHESLLEEV